MNSQPQTPESSARPGLLPRTASQLALDILENGRRQLYGKRRQGVSSTACHFVPLGQTDVLFLALRLVVFQIEPTSATSVAHIIREELSDAEIYDLLSDLYVCAPLARSKKVAKTHVRVASVTDRKGRIERAKKLKAKMDEARIKHSKNLHDLDFVDVDIIYKVPCYQIQPLKADKERIAALGGTIYHIYPFREHEKEMALTVIVKPHVLDEVFPLNRQEDLKISIKVNTAPARPEASSSTGRSDPGCPHRMFPYYRPDFSTADPEEKLDRVVKEIEGRSRSGSMVQKVKEAPKGPWHSFSSATRTENPQPTWSPTEGPFMTHPGSASDSQWWQDDLVRREAQLKDWDHATWKKVGSSFHRQLTDKDPETAIPGVDFPLIEPLCNVYTADRNDQWYKDNVERAELADQQMEYKTAQQLYDVAKDDAERFYKKYAPLQLEARLYPQLRRVQEQLAYASNCMHGVKRNMEVAEEQLAARAQACGQPLAEERLNVMQQLERKMWIAVKERHRQVTQQPAKSPSVTRGTPPTATVPNTPVQRHIRSTTHGRSASLNRTVLAISLKVASLLHPRNPPSQAGQDWSSPRGTLPFPAYKDPMASRAQDLAATQQDVSKPSVRPRAGRTNTARELASILAKTGVNMGGGGSRVDSAQAAELPAPMKAAAAQGSVDEEDFSDGETVCSSYESDDEGFEGSVSRAIELGNVGAPAARQQQQQQQQV